MRKIALALALCAFGLTGVAAAQQRVGSLKGVVLDELGGAIVGASVTAIDSKGVEKSAVTNESGTYTINGLVPGKYTLRAINAGFAMFENTEVEVVAGRPQQLDITLKVAIEEQKVTIAADSREVSVEPENNASAVVLKGEDIESLPDDPDDLAAALQALAGPSAGPNGGQIFVDGFTGGRLPPRASIREVRINSNPFSAEYDRLGLGRIEILTRPGSDRFRGQVSLNFNDESLNARNPFSTASTRPPLQTRQYGGNFGGPIKKGKSSFFVDFDKRDVDDETLIVAQVLDANGNIVDFRDTFPIPNRRTSFSPRIDYAINQNHTLIGRYNYSKTTRIAGVGGYQLPSRAYDSENTEHGIQLTETAIINKKIINETRFQFERNGSLSDADNSVPTIEVQDAFTGGGSQVGQSHADTNNWEVTNNTTFAHGPHSMKFGVRYRKVDIVNFSPSNFGGTYTFFGGNLAPNVNENGDAIVGANTITSIERYRRTLQYVEQGRNPLEIRVLGGGATQFRLSTGNPEAKVKQWDFGGYFQDDWKARPNFTLSLGLRYENQKNIDSNFNFGPRLGFAWSPGGPQSKTVIRGGYGVFYERVSENLTMQATRFNGVNQQQFTVLNPDFFPLIPTPEQLLAFAVPGTVYRLADNLQAPYTLQAVFSVERQLPHNITVASSYINLRTLHVLRTRPINAPLPGTFIPGVPGTGEFPVKCSDFIPPTVNPSTQCNIFEYESSGRYNQNQFIVNFNSRFTRNASLNAYYVLAKANSDADGTGSLPANPYDFSTEYGRASGDIRHRFVLTGNIRSYWGVSLAPFVIVQSGRPFNITLGRDINNDSINTERPAFAPEGTVCTQANQALFKCTPFGNFKTAFAPGDVMIPRNFGEGPGSVTVNLRVSKTWSFGSEGGSGGQQNRQQGQQGQGQSNEGGQRAIMGGGGGMRGAGGGPGGGGPGGGPGGGGFQRGPGGGGFGGGGGGQGRYNLTFSLNFNNILNHVNFNNPVGNIGSKFFGTSTGISGFGGFGGGGFGGGGAAYNRRIDAQIRFSF